MQGHIGNYLLPRFGTCTIRTITAEKVNEWLSTDDVSHLAPKTQKHIVTTLAMITGVKFGRGAIRYPLPRTIKKEQPCFAPEQMTALIENSEDQDRAIYATASETGVRASELYGLEITDLDYVREQIHVRRSVYDGEVKQSLKTRNASRVIPVQPWLIELLKQHIGDRKFGLLFMNERNQPIRHTTFLRRHLHPLLKRLGFPKCGMHAFRHGRVSLLVERGVPREIIKRWIGHGSDAMIELYTHLRPEYGSAALAKVQSLQPNHPTVTPSTSGIQVAVGA